MDIYDKSQKYFVNHSRSISMNGDPDKFTNLMHAYNMFLNHFFIDYVGGGMWAQDQFLGDDVQETTISLVKLLNSPEDSLTIGMLNFIDGLKPAPIYYAKRGHCWYKNAMTFYDQHYPEHGYDPISVFRMIMKLLKIESIQDIARAEFKAAGLPYMNINYAGG